MRIFKDGEFRLLWPFYLDALISPMLFFMPAFAVLYFRDFGFSLFQISLLTTVIAIFMILFEIPTGAVADLYGRKFSVLLGTIIQGLSLVSIFFLREYYHFFIAFAILGIGNTFNSGAREAWVTDLVKKERKKFLHDYFVKINSIDSFGLVVSGILGAFLVKEFGTSVIWIAGGISFFATFILLIFARENFVKRNIKVKESFKNLRKQSFVSLKYAKNHSVLFLFLIASAIFFFANVFSGDLAWITLLQELNFPEYAFGYMWSAMGVAGIFAPLVSLKLLRKGRERYFIIWTIALMMSSLFLIIFVNNFFFALLILLSSVFFIRMNIPVERVYFHKFVQSKLRATIGSVEGMLISLVGIIALPLAGLSVDYLGARYTLLLSALLMIPSLIIYFRINEKGVK